MMEPNQALAYTNQLFPTGARLRKCGYHLDQHILTLTFDFPEVVSLKYASLIDDLQAATGWTVEMNLETNQSALNGPRGAAARRSNCQRAIHSQGTEKGIRHGRMAWRWLPDFCSSRQLQDNLWLGT